MEKAYFTIYNIGWALVAASFLLLVITGALAAYGHKKSAAAVGTFLLLIVGCLVATSIYFREYVTPEEIQVVMSSPESYRKPFFDFAREQTKITRAQLYYYTPYVSPNYSHESTPHPLFGYFD